MRNDNSYIGTNDTMKDMSLKVIILGIIGIIIFFIIVIFAGVAYFNDNPGGYGYTINVEGLSNYQPSLITDIIVPLPVRDGHEVFSNEELQYKSFGDWKSVLVMTPYGKMLAFESIGRNLTDLHAEFFKVYPEGTKIENITSESFSPVLPFTASNYTQWVYGKDSSRLFNDHLYPGFHQTALSRIRETYLSASTWMHSKGCSIP